MRFAGDRLDPHLKQAAGGRCPGSLENVCTLAGIRAFWRNEPNSLRPAPESLGDKHFGRTNPAGIDVDQCSIRLTRSSSRR
jgi:hypothetical protein